MKKSLFILIILVSFLASSCKKDSDNPVTVTSPSQTGWSAIYTENVIGTFNCTLPPSCFYDIVTDSLDMTKCDSIRILLYYHSYNDASMYILKFPYPVEFLDYTFPDSTAGKIDTVLTSFKSKVVFDFAFTVKNKFIIDTLKVYKKL